MLLEQRCARIRREDVCDDLVTRHEIITQTVAIATASPPHTSVSLTVAAKRIPAADELWRMVAITKAVAVNQRPETSHERR